MIQNKKFSLFLPYIVAFVVYAAVAMGYFAPQFAGKEFPMHDVTQYWGMSQDIREHKAVYGEDPQWEGNMFSGMPSYLISFDHNNQVLGTINKALMFLGEPAAFLFLAMAGFMFLLVLWGVNPWTSIVPSLAYGLSTYTLLIIGAGHIAKVMAMAYAPMMLGAVFYTYRRNMTLGAALSALMAGLEIMVNHPQITYYFTMVLAAFWINELIKAVREKTLPHFTKATCLLLLAGALALGANFSSLYYVSQHTKYTIRGGSELKTEGANPRGLDIEYATDYSYGVGESFNLYIPNFKGGASDGGFSDNGTVAESLGKYRARNMATHLPAYWGDQPFTAGPTYIGAVAMFLCVLGLFMLRGRDKWWIVAISILALALSWGKNMMWLTELFFNWFPGYDKFRTVSMIQVILQWSIPFLGALALWKMWKLGDERADAFKAGKKALYVTGGIALFFLLLGGTIFDFWSSYDASMGLPDDVLAAMRKERASMLKADAFRSLAFVVLTAAVLLMYLLHKLKRGTMVVLLAALVLLDLVPVNLRYMPWSKFVERSENTIKPSEADKLILQDTTPGYRVANFTVSTFNDATTSYFHRSIGGYHGAKLQRYQDIISQHLARNNMEVYNMLNTKYFITEQGVQQNSYANGPVWFVESIDRVNGAQEEIDALNYIDTRIVAVVDGIFDVPAGAWDVIRYDEDETAEDVESLAFNDGREIALTEYRVNYLKYDYSSDDDAVAVFSEIYYPDGWTAYVDGVEAPHFRADYILRAMVLPAGGHTVEFRFEAPNFRAVSAVTIASSVMILLWVAGAAAYSYKRKKEEDVTGEQQEN